MLLFLSITSLFPQNSIISFDNSICNRFKYLVNNVYKDTSVLRKLSSEISYNKFKSITKFELLGGEKEYNSIYLGSNHGVSWTKEMKLISPYPIKLIDDSKSITIDISLCNTNGLWFSEFHFTEYPSKLGNIEYEDFIAFDTSILAYYKIFKTILVDKYTNLRDSLIKYNKLNINSTVILNDSTVAALIVQNKKLNKKINKQEKALLMDFFYSWFKEGYQDELKYNVHFKNKIEVFIQHYMFPSASIEFKKQLIGVQISAKILKQNENEVKDTVRKLYLYDYYLHFDSRYKGGLKNWYNSTHYNITDREIEVAVNNLKIKPTKVLLVSQRVHYNDGDTMFLSEFKNFTGLHIFEASYKLPISRGREMTFSSPADIHLNNNILFGRIVFRVFKPRFLSSTPRVEVTFAQKNTKYYNVNKLKRILTKYGFENVSFILPKEYSLYQTIPFYFKEKVR